MADVLIRLLLDESGSMGGREASVISGANQFVTKLRDTETEDRVLVTVAKFDKSGGKPIVRYVYENVPIEGARELHTEDYRPRGTTPLNDAVSEQIGKAREKLGEGDRVMYVIVTDGAENASEIKTEQIRKIVADEESAGGEFIYLGANVDQFAESRSLGLSGKRGSVGGFISSAPGLTNACEYVASRASTFAKSDDLYAATADSTPDVVAEDSVTWQAQNKTLDEAVAKAEASLSGKGS